MRNARRDVALFAAQGERAIHRARRVAALRDQDVVELQVAAQGQLLADARVIAAHDANVLFLEEQLMTVPRRYLVVKTDHEIRLGARQRARHLVAAPWSHLDADAGRFALEPA